MYLIYILTTMSICCCTVFPCYMTTVEIFLSSSSINCSSQYQHFLTSSFFFISLCNDNFSRISSVGFRNSRRKCCKNFDLFTNFHAIYTKALEKRRFIYFTHQVKIHNNGNMFIPFYCFFSFYCVVLFVTASKSADSRNHKDTFQNFEINLKEVPVGSFIFYGSCSKQNV